MTSSMKALLSLENIRVNYGAIEAVKGVSLSVMQGELVCLVGANGAGKSTLLKRIVGLLPSTNGEIIFDGENISQQSTYKLVSKGIALVPEGRGIFDHMSVSENLLMGAFHREKGATSKRQIQHDIEHTLKLFPRLAERQHQMAGTLSGGEQQMVAIARALLSKPKLLLLDEPSMGLAPILVQKIFEIIKTINDDGVSILLVEQNANAALALANRGYVMEHGEIVLSGDAQQLSFNPAVKKAYLGG